MGLTKEKLEKNLVDFILTILMNVYP